MSNKYDIESFLTDILNVVQNNLPAKITEINAEKNDAIVLDSIPNENYFVSSGEQVFNENVFIYYGITDIITNTSGAKTSQEVTINFEVVFNNLNSNKTLERVLRYSRCLREVLQENFKSGRHTNLKINELVPTNAQINQGSDFKVGGVKVSSIIIG